jgi:hypothetical protein
MSGEHCRWDRVGAEPPSMGWLLENEQVSIAIGEDCLLHVGHSAIQVEPQPLRLFTIIDGPKAVWKVKLDDFLVV